MNLKAPKNDEFSARAGNLSEFNNYQSLSFGGARGRLSAVYDTIYSKWLPESGQPLRNYHCFEIYINNPDKTPPEKLKTEIYIPVE